MATTIERPGPLPVHKRRAAGAPWPLQFYRSAVGKKWVMAVTGIMLMTFVFLHALGNLKVYLGAEHYNHYSQFLRQLLVPILPSYAALWIMRLGLLTAFVLHIHAAWCLTRINRASRAGAYQHARDWQVANIASRSMRWTGAIVAMFVVFHLADLSTGTLNPDYVEGDVYRNFVATFERPLVSLIYIVANVALALHLFHGAWSMFQSLGVNHPRWNAWRRAFAAGFAGSILVINVSFPLSVLTGVVSAHENPDCRVVGDRIETCRLYEEAYGSASGGARR